MEGLNCLCSGAWTAGLSVVEILLGALDSLHWPNAGRQQRETNGVETGSPLNDQLYSRYGELRSLSFSTTSGSPFTALASVSAPTLWGSLTASDW